MTVPSNSIDPEAPSHAEETSSAGMPVNEGSLARETAKGPEQPSSLPVSEDHVPDETILNLLVSDQRMRSLWTRADTVQKQVYDEINNVRLAKSLLDQIQRARNELMSGKGAYEDAERALNEVTYRLAFNRRMVSASRKDGTKILIYEGIWLLVLGTGITLINLFEARFESLFLSQFISSLLWGSLGGVVGALYALWKHVADEQDFDSQYTLWYITNPLLGLALGAFVFLIIQAGFFSLTASEGGTASINTPLVIYVLAWISGFKQNVVYEIVRRILDVFR
ncbi:MAG: hypothetical protein ABFD44_14960, partial [Anaerolineaceae bacterium]